MTRATVATIKVKPGQEAQFEAVTLKLAAAVNANEPGCLLYTLNKGEEASTYVFMERYKDEEAAIMRLSGIPLPVHWLRGVRRPHWTESPSF